MPDSLAVEDIDRRLACVGRAIDLALAMRDRPRFHRACAVRAELRTLRAERERVGHDRGRYSMEEQT
ncbi:hypothetical protein [Actinokineospora sp.]|uniref:hypothetical protein n=1 Tax=Actinokineospora sp. TaxID=1872133 RepID=UPI00403780AB